MKEIKPHIRKVKGRWCVTNLNAEEVKKDWSIAGRFELAVRWCVRKNAMLKNKELGI